MVDAARKPRSVDGAVGQKFDVAASAALEMSATGRIVVAALR
jgi:hypothetical protein